MLKTYYLLRICLRNIVSQVYIILYKPRDMWSICNRNYGIHRTLNNERIERNAHLRRKICTKNEWFIVFFFFLNYV